MKKNKVIKCLLASVTVLAVLWIAILLCMVNKSSSISLMKNTQALPYEQKALTSMMISDTVTNIRITQGDTLKVGYEIINTGSDTLFLFDINPDCTCTDYQISAMSAAPADTIALNLIIDTRNKIRDNLIHVVLETNTEEKMYMIRLPFFVDSGCVPMDSLETKRNFRFSRLRVGDPKIIYSKIKNNYSKDILIEMMTSCECINVTPRSIYLKSGGRCEYTITARPDVKGDYSEYVIMSVIGTNHKIKVNVSGTVE